MYVEKVSPEVAAVEVNKWVARHKLFPSRLALLNDQVATLVEAVTYGVITIDETSGEITHQLQFPILDDNGSPHTEKLTYKNRVNTAAIMKSIEAHKSNTADAKILAYCGNLTSTPTALLQKLMPVDATICQTISVFFI